MIETLHDGRLALAWQTAPKVSTLNPEP